MPTNVDPKPLELALPLGWFLTGALWFAQAWVPWTASGPLSHSSALDAAGLIRSGAVESVAPATAGWLLPALPAVGLVLCASAFSRHPLTGAFRLLSVMTALAITGALSYYLARFDVTNFGPGALLAWLGCTAFVISTAVSLRTHST